MSRRCTWDCSKLHGGTYEVGNGVDFWLCTHPDAPKEPVDTGYWSVLDAMLLEDFEYGQPCVIPGLTEPTLF